MTTKPPENNTDPSQQPTTSQPSQADTLSYQFTLPDTIRALIAKPDKPEYTPAEMKKLQKVMLHYKNALDKLRTTTRLKPNPADETNIRFLLDQSEKLAWTTISPNSDRLISLETKKDVEGYIVVIPNNHPQALAQQEIARLSAAQKAVWIKPDAYSTNMAATIYAFSIMLLHQRIVQQGVPKAGSNTYYQNFVNAYLAEILTLDNLTGNKLKTFSGSLNNRFGFTNPEQVQQIVKNPGYRSIRQQFDKIFFGEPPRSTSEDSTRNTLLIFSMAFALMPGTPEEFMAKAIQFMRIVYTSNPSAQH